MTDELRFPGPSGPADSDSLSEPLKGMIRSAYSPPVSDSDSYWAGLETRIMARVRAEGADDSNWWSVLAPWAQAGLIAATAIFAVSGVINQRISAAESQYAYESAVTVPTPDVDASAAILAGPDKTTGSDATLEYVLSH
jgi:hypothetical protein